MTSTQEKTEQGLFVQPGMGDVIRALEEFSLSLHIFLIDYKRERHSVQGRAEIAEKWQFSPDMLRAQKTRLAIAGECLRVGQSKFRGKFLERRDVAYDGANLHVAEHMGVTVYSPALIREEFSSRSAVFDPGYFEASGIRMPSRVGQLRAPPTSIVLEAVYDGASLAKLSPDHGRKWCVSHNRDRVKRVYVLDVDLGCAVTEWKEFRDDVLVRSVEAEQFQQVGNVYLPRRAVMRWFGWPGIEEISNQALLLETFEVLELTCHVSAADVAPYKGRPGDLVFDSRYATQASSDSGYFGYQITPEIEAIVTAYESEVSPQSRSSLSVWVSFHVFALALFAIALKCSPRNRASDPA